MAQCAEVRQVLMDPRFNRSSLRAPDAPPLLVVRDTEAATTAAEQLLRTVPLSEGRVPPGLIRRAVEDTEVGDVLIPAGSVVAVQTNSAGRAPDVFPPGEPDLFAPLPS
ncbi:cytochrome P450 [Streptomyces sp. DT2A-34]|uniref:cytochrome P450 n=1 Tax=Streptomyces sp. DT2A-34 TaxID=3051182 RepID=UPI00265B838B|nr:cytochrome P450 [Streptomyces sp. DT2A-34]MDO0909648.1 cytochrome P450 [Streptomyces sp. DT2A-34]